MIKVFKIIKRKYRTRKFNFYIAKCNKHRNQKNKKVLYFCRKYGFSIDDYYTYQLFKNDYKNYISTLDSYIPRDINDPQMMVISDNKVIFPYFMDHFFNVAENVALIDQNGKIEQYSSVDMTLLEFMKKNPVICKPFNGYDGQKIFNIFYCNNHFIVNGMILSERELVPFLSDKHNFLIQKQIKPHEYSKTIFPFSLNTIRIITCKNKLTGLHEIVCAVHRFGTQKSKPVDNFAQGGISALIDIPSGMLGKATSWYLEDKNNNRLFLSKHPDTESQIEGVVVPHWDAIKNKLMDFSKNAPFFKFIAWDIAINETGDIIIIETNMKSSLDVFQVHFGMKNTKLDYYLQEFKHERK